MKVRPMDKDFILYRCVQFGPISPADIETMPAELQRTSKEHLERSREFLARSIDTYGSCAMLAVEGDHIVAHARFYPQIICDQYQFCCQDPEHAITQQMVEMDLPTMENPADRILRINCILVHENYRGRGLSHALLEGILEWAKAHHWSAVRAWAASDNYWLSSQICAPMLRTYAKHGFRKTRTFPPSDFPSSAVRELLSQIQEGELGPEKKKQFEEFCGGQDLSELALVHEVERRL